MVTKIEFIAIDDLNMPSKFDITFEGKLECSEDVLKSKILERLTFVKNIQILSSKFDETYKV